jgi:hypothetical protein
MSNNFSVRRVVASLKNEYFIIRIPRTTLLAIVAPSFNLRNLKVGN